MADCISVNNSQNTVTHKDCCLLQNILQNIVTHTQRTHTSLRRLQEVLKRSRRLATKQDVVTTSGKRRRIYEVLKTSDLRRLKDVQFRTS